ncbi:FAD-dependent oxidoreductase [Roseateles cavernae]|uniref:FAD-dependent oxidoreductase n=1 Tax=Roseateles cavernae TaxID=3153578 RepID=UPI0032E4F7EB
MGSLRRPFSNTATDPVIDSRASMRCDVLVIGAGCAGTQAARAAAAGGARVLLVDRLDAAELDKNKQQAPAQALAMQGRGRLLRRLAEHTALELLLDREGAVRGAAGVGGTAETPWRIEAAAVIIASSEALLMAAEAGAQLSGMEHGGGLRAGVEGASTVDGLYAAGGAAWQPMPAGIGLPQGTVAHALLSGQQAGAGAAAAATRAQQSRATRALCCAGLVGLRGSGHRPANPLAIHAALQAVLGTLAHREPSAAEAAEALSRLDALWQFLCRSAAAPQGALCATRAVAGRLAVARWRLRSVLARRASEAAHQASECVISGGVDEAWARAEMHPELKPRPALHLLQTPAARLSAFAL